jgi:hypothetical protein
MYGYPMTSIVSVHQLVSNAIVLDGANDDGNGDGDEAMSKEEDDE